MRNLIIFFFLSVILNALMWIFLVPVWHTPDEQAHFSQVANVVERGRNPLGHEMDVTEETYVSEQLLGTARDKVGNNKFTFHPEYKIEYTDSLIGKYEASIAALTKTDAKQKFVYKEATRYPLLYYIPASWIYKIFYSADIFTRIFFIRFWSLIFFILNIWIAYKIGRLIFPKNQFMAITLGIFTGFQPMMIFSNIGVTSDSFGNLVFTFFLYICLRLILYGLKVKELVFLTVASWLALSVKTQFIIILPVVFILLIFLCFRDLKGKLKLIIPAILFFSSMIFVTRPYEFRQFTSLLVAADSLKQFNLESFLKFTKEYTLSHTVSEVMPWYWGVYKWLGVTYPRIIHRIINRLVFISLVGFAIWFIGQIINRRWNNRQFQSISFLIFVSAVYFGAIAIFDWLSWYQSGFQLGVQGRYFFPLITGQMLILLIGLVTLSPKKWNIREKVIKSSGLLMIFLNFYGLYTVASSYYNLSPINIFLQEISQYKPFFMKVPFNVIIFCIYILFLVLFLYRYITQPKNGKI